MARVHEDTRSRRAQIAADLRARIMSGEMAAGSQLPSTQHLVAEYDASSATIQDALKVLKAEGYLTSRKGKGVYVSERHPFVVEVAAYIAPSPDGYSYELLEVAEVRPASEVATALRLDADAAAILRRRLLRHDGQPVELSWSYYPAGIARGSSLAKRGKIRGGAPQALADLGYPEREFTDRVSVRLPTTEEFTALELSEDVPVIRQLRVIYSDRGVPVEASILVKPGHLYELQYRVPGVEPTE